MYGQFGKKTILIASKIMEGRKNNVVLNEDEAGDLIVLFSFFFLLNGIKLIYSLIHSISYQILLETKEKDVLQVKFLV
jgi:hypothetical protein